VVNGQIFVLQKHELTQLMDRNGDDLIDEYRSICNSWTVSADFHEFAFGLVHKEGFFYATLSMAMRLKPHEKQLPDRGKTIKIGMDGSYEAVNFGLRTPNGLGLGVDDELFVTDNQGQWLPANKLIHVRKGDFHGMGWGWLSDDPMPEMTPPTIWLPQDEIGNSPTEIVLVKEGIYKGQMLHGDVTHGGIKRDFVEKINGQYQGAVFRFSQGFEAGVNRLRWGPDGALYVGEVGMTGGGWSWRERLRGLQRLKHNGKITFEMLAVRVKSKGFEIELTEALEGNINLKTTDLMIHQWWYQPTPKYGGPKMDLEQLTPTQLTLSPDRKKLYLEIPNLKTKHVVYFRLPSWLKSQSGHSLWASEAWYTLNHIPE
jgi:cytochrome c